MVFHVDNFLIGRPGTTSDYPFALGTVDGVTRLSLKNAWIQDAAIKNAKIANAAIESAHIKDASVETLKIAGNAVSVMAVSTGANITRLTGSYADMLSVTMTTVAGHPVMISFYASVQVEEANCQLRLLRGGSSLQSDITIAWVRPLEYGAYTAAQFTAAYFFVDTNPPNGSVTYKVQLKNAGGIYVDVHHRALTALHVKR